MEVKKMSVFPCNCTNRCSCILAAIIASVILGVIAAFAQITGVITVATVFLWAALGFGVVYLAAVLLAAALTDRSLRAGCLCDTLDALLVGILGTVLFAIVLLAAGTTATSIISAILVGLLTAALTLTVTATACFIRNLLDCGS